MNEFESLTTEVKSIYGLRSTGKILVGEIINRIIDGSIQDSDRHNNLIDKWIQAYLESMKIRMC